MSDFYSRVLGSDLRIEANEITYSTYGAHATITPTEGFSGYLNYPEFKRMTIEDFFWLVGNQINRNILDNAAFL